MNTSTDKLTEKRSGDSLQRAGSASPFDLEKVYDSELAPLMAQVIEICKRVEMPMLACFCYRKGKNADDPEGVDYCTTTLPRGDWQTPEIKEAVRTIYNGASDRPKLMAFAVTTRTPNAALCEVADKARPN